MEFEVNGRKVVQGAVRALAIVESFDVVEDVATGLGVAGEGAAVDQLKLEGAPEAFHGGVVIAVGLAAHGGNQARPGQSVSVIGGGVLDAAVGVEEQVGGRVPVQQRHG